MELGKDEAVQERVLEVTYSPFYSFFQAPVNVHLNVYNCSLNLIIVVFYVEGCPPVLLQLKHHSESVACLDYWWATI